MQSLRLSALAATMALASCDSVTPPPDAVELGRRLLVNENAACALDREGVVWCWGNNGPQFEYGAPATVIPPSRVPVRVPVPRLYSLASGRGTHFCGIDFDDDAVCWGRGTFGQLGRGSPGETGNGPAVVSGTVAWDNLTLGRISTCGLGRDGFGYCWGTNQRGEVGVDTVPTGVLSTVPRRVLDGDVRFKTIVAGWLHACGITTANQTFCWGDNRVGQLGNGTADTLARRIPTLVAGNHVFVSLALSAKHSCGIDEAGLAFCWGNNQFGQLGDGTTADRHEPTAVIGGTKFSTLALGSGFAGLSAAEPPDVRTQGGAAHSCGLTESGTALCWGWNGNGQLGDGSVTDRHTPVALSGNLAFDVIGAAGSYTCGMKANAMWCWGSNVAGQLGNGTTTAQTVPTPVATPFDRP